MIPVGGDTLQKIFPLVLRTSTEDAEKIKIKHGHAFYDDASEDEVFQCSNHRQRSASTI